MLKVYVITGFVGFVVVKVLQFAMEYVATHGTTCAQIADTALMAMCK